MKKILTLLFVFLLVSCAGNKFSFSDKYYGEGKLIELSEFAAFEKVEESEENFALYVYMPGCTTCATFKPVVEQYAKDNGINILMISSSIIMGKDNSIMETIEYTPSIILYKEGKPVAFLDANSNKDIKYYESVEGLTKWFNKYTLNKK